MSRCGIYQWLNGLTGKMYIGSSVDVLKRAYNHQWALRKSAHPNEKFQRAWSKYGEAAFELSVLERCDKGQLIEREQFWLDTLKAVDSGYNIVPIAGSTAGRKFSAATKALIGLKSRERNQGSRHPMFGRKHSEESRQKISVSNTGKHCGPHKPMTAEHRARISEAARRRDMWGSKNPYYGRKHSDETRAKMRAGWRRRLESLSAEAAAA